MKKRSPLTITISLAILAATSLPIVAQQSKRYPTENQLQQLINQFRNFVASPPEGSRGFYLRDTRNAAQSQSFRAFVRAWLAPLQMLAVRHFCQNQDKLIPDYYYPST